MTTLPNNGRLLLIARDALKARLAQIRAEGDYLAASPQRILRAIVDLNVELAKTRHALEGVQYKINKLITTGKESKLTQSLD